MWCSNRNILTVLVQGNVPNVVRLERYLRRLFKKREACDKQGLRWRDQTIGPFSWSRPPQETKRVVAIEKPTDPELLRTRCLKKVSLYVEGWGRGVKSSQNGSVASGKRGKKCKREQIQAILQVIFALIWRSGRPSYSICVCTRQA